MNACPHCQADVPGDARHCPNCGGKLQPQVAVDRNPKASGDPDKGSTERATPADLVNATAPGEPLPEGLGSATVFDPDDPKLDTPVAPPAGAPKPSPPPRAEPGTIVDNKYAVVRVLGEGGMGVVYLARDVHTGIEVVLKAVRPELAHRQDIRLRTLAEGRTLAKIDHPNVVHLNAVVAQGTNLWLVMPYIDGESIDKTIKRHLAESNPMPLVDVLNIFRQILSGVEAAHEEGIIHRDLKPANVLIRRKDRVVKVTDFGIAKPEEQAREGKGNTKGVIGSLWYMSPEQVLGRRDLDKRVDIYALGILLFELLVGHVPFDAPSSYELMKKHTEEPLPRILRLRPDLPAAIEGILDRACAKDRDKRFQSCGEFRTALAALNGAVSSTQESLPIGPASVHRPSAAHAGSDTETAASLTSPGTASSGRGGLYLIAALVVGGGGLAAAFALGAFNSPSPTPATPGATTTTGAAISAAPSASSPPEDARAPLEKLVGLWRAESGRDLEAVMTAGQLEFRVVDAAQFGRQAYATGEARFTLRALEGEDETFAVDDLIRPLPPEGTAYSDAARNTCHEVWSEAGGHPLRATYDGERLTVDFAKVEPKDRANFMREGNVVISCVGLGDLKAGRARLAFTRAP